MNTLYPAIEPYNEFKLNVTDLHTIHVEESGNPEGKPVVFLHGGPGGGIEPIYRQYFDSDKWRIIIFDQRGCGKSTPHAELQENTTWDLVADIETIRKHLEIDKWVVFGGSWGSTLSLSYSIIHPDRCKGLVLRGIFLIRKKEIDWFYQNGASNIYPDAWEKYLKPIFFEYENWILNNVGKICHLPIVIIQGRYDVVCPMVSAWELHRALPNADFEVIKDAGHSMSEKGIASKLIEYTDKFSDL